MPAVSYTHLGIDVAFYYSAKHERVMRECNVDSVLKRVFDYCTEHYGPLSFYGDGTMKLIEICNVGGGYAAAGASVMEMCIRDRSRKEQIV